MAKDINTVLDKLRKLVEHEQSARKLGSINEANAFAEKIAQLCEDYRVEVASLGKEEAAKVITKKEIRLNDHGILVRRQQAWLVLFHATIAQCHGCQRVFTPDGDIVSFIGLEGDAHVAAEMMIILLKFAFAELRRTRKQHPQYIIGQADFMKGFASGLFFRYQEREKKRSESTTALVRVVDQVIRDFVEESFPRSDREYNFGLKSSGAAGLGYRSAQAANLDTNQLNQSSATRAALPAKAGVA